MFIIDIRIRIALIALFMVGGIALAIAYGIGYSIPFLLVGIILIAGYLLLGTIGSASKALQANDIAAAEKQLTYTKWPQFLYSANKAYFYMLKGVIAMQKKETKKGEELFNKAKEIGLPTDQDKAMVSLNLASMAYNRRNFARAKALLKEAKGYDISEPMLTAQIKELENAIKMGNATMGRQHGKGGFRVKKR